jgi:hypothetical protein
MSNLIASPDFAMFFGTISIDKSVIIAVVIAYLVLFNVGSWFLLNKRDMKG